MKHTRTATASIAVMTAMAAWTADYHVSPTGNDSNPGTELSPLKTLKAAIGKAEKGTTIFLHGGTHKPSAHDIMRPGGEGKVYDCVYYLDKNGTEQEPITISGYPGEQAVIDLSDIKTGNRIIGFDLKGDHWHLKDFDIVGIQVTQKGHTQSINVGLFGGSNCIVECVNMHDGMGIGVYATKGRDNLILNCDAYNNYDPVSENGHGGNCDGFGFHLKEAGSTGNVISGCRAWRNSDDGFDLINNFYPVVIENCWAWENGYDAEMVSRGDGTGFKSGGFGMKPHAKAPAKIPRNIVRDCIAWANKNQGFYANHHLGGLDFINNSAYANRRNFNMVNRKSRDEATDVDGYGHNLTNNVAFGAIQADGDCVNIDMEKCTVENNSFGAAIQLSADDFESLDASQLKRSRKKDGSLPDIDFMKLKKSFGCTYKKDRHEALRHALTEYIKGKDANIGVAVIIEGKDTVEVNGKDRFPMLSVYKFPIALAMADHLRDYGMTLDLQVRIQAEDLHSDTYSPMTEQILSSGLMQTDSLTMTAGTLLNHMLQQSDNNASDIILKTMGGTGRVTAYLKSIGSRDISVVSTEDEMHADNSLCYSNSSTPVGMAALMYMFDTAHNDSISREIKNMMETCATGTGRLALPLAPAGAVVGHKTGTGFTLPDGRLMAVNDAGYVHLPDGRKYAIAVFVENSGYDMQQTESLIAEISEMVYSQVVR